MAIQFARTQYVSRSTGGNACRKAAYNERSVMKCERTGEIFYFADHSDNVHHEIMLPIEADAKFKNSHALWNEAERCERRIDSQVAKEMVLALPDDDGVRLEHRIELTRSFIQKHFVDKGLAAQIDIHAPHENDKNWHAHVLLTTRRFKENGQELGEKARDLNQSIRKGFVAEGWDIGQSWKEHQNAFFQEKGLSISVDPIGIVAQEHIGPVRMRQHMSEALERAKLLRAANEEAARNPEEILEALTRNQSVFTEKDVDRFLNKHCDSEDREELKKQVLNHTNIIPLYQDEPLKQERLFTTKAVRAEEEKLLRFAHKVNDYGIKNIISEAFTQTIESRSLAQEQLSAVHHVTQDSKGIAIIQGRAGTGKSYTINAICDVYQKSGYKVIGLAPTNQVADDMARSGVDTTMTAHSFLFRHKNKKLDIAPNTVLIVDEAAMLPTNALIELFNVAKEHQVKVALFGDDRQLASIKRGGMFSKLIQEFGSQALTEVRRQQGWQKAVSELLSEGKTEQAVYLLDHHKTIHTAENKETSLASLLQAWSEDSINEPSKTRLIIANKNVDVDAINIAAQESRIQRGEINSKGYVYPTARGPVTFFAGDRICFTDTNKELGLRNGAFGVIKSLDENHCTVELDQGQNIQFNPKTYHGMKLGYASTVYKSQGKSINQVYVLHDTSTNQKLSYVALTRQTQDLKIFVNQQETPTMTDFAKQINNKVDKLSSLHFMTAEELNPQHKGVLKDLWQTITKTTKNFMADRFHNNKEFYQLPDKKILANVEEIRQVVVPREIPSIQQYAEQALERNLKYCRFIHFKKEMGREPAVDDVDKIKDMAVRLSALEVGIYQETLLKNEPKTHQGIVKLAREEFFAGERHNPKLIECVQIRMEHHILALKKEMECQIQLRQQYQRSEMGKT